MTCVTDTELLRLSGKGDKQSFEILYNKYWYQLYVAANKVLQNDAVAEDVVQEIFISLWKKAVTLQVDNLNAYLYKAVKFQVAKKLREQSNLEKYLKDINTVIGEHHPQVIDKMHYSELLQKVNFLVSHLPDRCREIFIQSRFQHLSNAEIAAVHNITVKTVENQLNKALRYLRSHIDDHSFSLVLPVCIAYYQAFSC